MKQLKTFFCLILLFLVGCGGDSDAAATSTAIPATTAPLPTLTPVPATPRDTPTSEAAALPTATTGSAITSPASNLLNLAWDDRSLFAANLISSEQAILTDLAGATVYHLDV